MYKCSYSTIFMIPKIKKEHKNVHTECTRYMAKSPRWLSFLNRLDVPRIGMVKKDLDRT